MSILRGIKDLSNLTGLNEKQASRALEKGLVTSFRTGNGVRNHYYILDDVAVFRMKLIESLFGEGWTKRYLKEGAKEQISRTDVVEKMRDSLLGKEAEILTITNQKGGVGKTTDTCNLAAALAKLDMRVLVVDMDSQAQSSRYYDKRNFRGRSILRIFEDIFQRKDDEEVDRQIREVITSTSDFLDPDVSIDILPSELRLSRVLELMRSTARPQMVLKRILDTVKGDYDFILIDTPPYAGLSLEMSLMASDEVILATHADEFSVEGVEVTIEEIDEIVRYEKSDLKVNAAYINAYNNGLNHHRVGLEKIFDLIADRYGTDFGSFYPVKFAPSLVGGSQSVQLPIFEYGKSLNLSLSVAEPFFSHAVTLIENKLGWR